MIPSRDHQKQERKKRQKREITATDDCSDDLFARRKTDEINRGDAQAREKEIALLLDVRHKLFIFPQEGSLSVPISGLSD